MTSLLEIGLSNAALATAFAVGAALVGRHAGRPAVAHSLWLLVLLKLVTPPLWGVPLGWSPAGEPAEMAEVTVVANPETTIGASARAGTLVFRGEPAEFDACPPEPVFVDLAEVEGLAPVEGAEACGDVVGAAAVDWPIDATCEVPVSLTAFASPPSWFATAWRPIVGGVWLSGTLVFVGIAACRIASFRRLLGSAKPATERLQDRAEALARRIGLERAPGVWMVPGAMSPSVWALDGRARVLLPIELWAQLDEAQRDTLLTHELAHVRRKDHWVRLLELAATALFWWNPIVWWARHGLREAEELCCDAWVLWSLPESKKDYARALLETLDFLADSQPFAPPAASGISPVEPWKRRLTMILTGIAPKGLSPLTRLVLLGLGAALLPFSPLAAQQTAKVVEGKPIEVIKADNIAEVRVVEGKPIEGTATIAVTVDDEDDDDDKDAKKDKNKKDKKDKAEKVKEPKKRIVVERRGSPLTEAQIEEIKVEARAAAEKGRAAAFEARKEAAKARAEADKVREEAKEIHAKAFTFTTNSDAFAGKALDEKAVSELKKAKEELEVAQKKLAEAARKFAELQAKSVGGKVSVGTTFSSDAHVATAGEDGKIVVRKLLETRPGQQPKMEVRVETLNKGDGVPKLSVAPVPPVPPVPPIASLPPHVMTLRAIASDKQEKRIDEMEKKLDRILKQLESMKKDEAR